MTIQQADKQLREAGCSIDEFQKWERHQTDGLYPDGTIDIYSHDVERFIWYKQRGRAENSAEFD